MAEPHVIAARGSSALTSPPGPTGLDGPERCATLADVLARYEAAGFGAAFETVESAGSVWCQTCGTIASAACFTMHSLRRLEGASDPADMLAVVAVTCCNCGAKGTLVLNYGPGASAAEADLLVLLTDERGDGQLPRHSAPGEVIGDT